MNSNTRHQRSDNTFFNTPTTSASLTSIINQINSLQNPTTDDFERIIQQFQHFFSILKNNKDFIQDLQLKIFHIKLYFQH